MKKAYFPMFVDISAKKILVIGGGKIAARRILTLLEFSSCITVIAPKIEESLVQYTESGRIRWVQREYRESDLTENGRPDIVLASTDNTQVNESIGSLCREQGICVNVADKKEACDFYFPGIVKTDEVVIGINSGGENPGATKLIRKKLEEWVDIGF